MRNNISRGLLLVLKMCMMMQVEIVPINLILILKVQTCVSIHAPQREAIFNKSHASFP